MELKGETGDLKIIILKRTDTDKDDYWDSNWLESEIRINVPGFKALYGTNLRIDDLADFYNELIGLQNNTIIEAEFVTMEEGLYLNCKLQYNGAITCIGKANNSDGNNLNFNIQSDLASLDIFIDELSFVLESYPLIGHLDR